MLLLAASVKANRQQEDPHLRRFLEPAFVEPTEARSTSTSRFLTILPLLGDSPELQTLVTPSADPLVSLRKYLLYEGPTALHFCLPWPPRLPSVLFEPSKLRRSQHSLETNGVRREENAALDFLDLGHTLNTTMSTVGGHN